MLLICVQCAFESQVKQCRELVLHILDLTQLNAHAMYLMKIEKTLPLLDFQMNVV
jgi:hypothetical protein